MPAASVIVPSYNSFKTILHTLNSLLVQRESLLKEIIVVDSSDDGKTTEELEKFKSGKLQVIHLSQKTIPAVARNIGAREARGELLAFIDSDAYAAGNWLEAISKAYEEGCRVGGGALLLPDFQRKNPIAVAQYFLQFNEFMDAGAKRQKMFVPSCNLFCAKGLFDRVGGFPEIRACEDVLFGIKVNETEAVHFVPEVKIYHIFRENWASYLKNQLLLGKYILIYRRFHSGRFIYKGVFPVLLLPLFLVVKFLRITQRVVAARRLSAFLAYLSCQPWFLPGFFSWGAGFLKACFENNSEEGVLLKSFAGTNRE